MGEGVGEDYSGGIRMYKEFKKFGFLFRNYWKTSCDFGGFYFEPFCLSVHWKSLFGEKKHITFVILNFEFSFEWK